MQIPPRYARLYGGSLAPGLQGETSRRLLTETDPLPTTALEGKGPSASKVKRLSSFSQRVGEVGRRFSALIQFRLEPKRHDSPAVVFSQARVWWGYE